MSKDLFAPPAPGTCLYCGGENEDVALPAATLGQNLELGVCDVCSYALAHHWRVSRGERAGAQSPRLVRTYLLVPWLPKGRAQVDLSSYKFLVGEEGGGLPWLHYGRDPLAAVSYLEHVFGVETFPATTSPCYVGYDAGSNFSEVRLAWAWGRSLEREPLRPRVFKSLDELLAAPSPEAGFVLGVKQAFEGLLARRELSPESTQVCVQLREPAMRYLAYQNFGTSREPGEGREDEDADMVELCRAAMNTDELAVLTALERAEREAEGASRSAAGARPAPGGAAGRSAGSEAREAGDDDEEEDAREGEVAEGFARSPRRLSSPAGGE